MLKLRYLLVLPFLVLIVVVSCFGIAELYSEQALAYEDQWREAETIETKKEWDTAVDLLSTAIKLNPYNPSYPETMGRLYIWRYYIGDSPVTSPEEVEAILKEGVAYIDSSIAMRPAWPRIFSTLRKLIRVAEQRSLRFDLETEAETEAETETETSAKS